jgi:hypothetical protein
MRDAMPLKDEVAKLETKSQPIRDWIAAHPKLCWTLLGIAIVLAIGIKIGSKLAA